MIAGPCRGGALALALASGALIIAGCGGGSSPQTGLGLSPAPDTTVASPHTQISIRGASRSQLHGLTVVGSRSGRHGGRLVEQPGGHGTSFLPTAPFESGETVDVDFRDGGRRVRYRFTIARPAPLSVEAGPPGSPTGPGQVQSFHSAPDLRPPTVRVTVRSPAAAPGDVFLSPINKLGQPGPMILDGDGRLVWFDPLSGRTQAFSFERQSYDGRPVLTWWQGIVSSRGYGDGEDVIADSAYRRIATVRAAEGYSADLHDFVLTPDGDALITAYNPVRMDLRSVGGPRDGTALDGVFQEIDVRTGLVLFEWHSVGHVALQESYAKPASDGVFDYFHINSVQPVAGGDFLVSARNTWTIYKIDGRTGKIIWRLGGKRSSFRMGPGTQTAYQHDARRQPDGTITVFDNGADPKVHPESRAIALRLDVKAMTVTVAHQWTHPAKLLAGSQGNMQTLPNGDRFVGWGALPDFTEFSPDGKVLFDGAMASPDTSYRAYRFPWSASPSGRPAVATARAPGGKLDVYASWNGATAVARWRILAGASATALKPVAEAPRTGFETSAAISPAAFVSVEAQSASGRVLGTSAPVRAG